MALFRGKMNRRQFIESQGATCRNWQWSWSFINEEKRFIIFGAWDRNTQGGRTEIFSEDWEHNHEGRRNSGYKQSREHIRLIEEEGFDLYTFPIKYSDSRKDESGNGPAKLDGFEPVLDKRHLIRFGRAWHVGETGGVVKLAEELPELETLLEGAKVNVTINAYERSAKARAQCIRHHGLDCAVCGFNFGKEFGSLGNGFIHVHHVVPIGSVGEEYEVDPTRDLIPVCPNCHAMIHRVTPPLSIEELKQRLER